MQTGSDDMTAIVIKRTARAGAAGANGGKR